ncbi:MAG: hypothetical protein PHQ12_04825 [Chthoniobacteraceae bacterium]|nr:hypothetical protein [Chthoniobacteraceae bacterium]
MKRLLPILEKSLVALIFLLFCAPLVHWGGKAVSSWATPKICKWRGEPVPRSARHHKKRKKALAQASDWKKDITKEFNENFLFRTELIRGTNEAFFRLWNVSPAPIAEVAIGKDDFLYEKGYLREYFLDRPKAESLVPLVEKIKRFQDLCDRCGIKFALLITPGKPSIHPEHIPDEWMERYDSRPRAYALFLPLLQRYGVRYVDGPAITQQAKPQTPTSIFSKGGTHWTYHGALFTTNALIDCLREQGEDLARIETTPPKVSNEPTGTDTDLLVFINLLKPWNYPVTQFDIKPADTEKPRLGRMTFIGGSFSWQIAQEIEASKQFSEVDVFFYYKIYKAINSSIVGTRGSMRMPTGTVDFENEIYANECLVLELNETIIATQKHLSAFLDDAFAHLPQRDAKVETLAR